MAIQTRNVLIGFCLIASFLSTGAMAEDKPKKRATPKSSTDVAPAGKSQKKSAPVKVDSSAAMDGYVGESSTHIDFSDTEIDGKMKAPEGFMLQGHQSSSLSQMVKLRSNFRNELNNSKSATQALVK